MRAALVLLAACGVSVKGGNARDLSLDASATDAATDTPAVAPPDARACTGGDANATVGTTCLVYVKAALAWTDARTACQAMTADLAIVTDKPTNDAIASMIGSAADPASTVFLGGTDAVTEGTWLWVDTTQFWQGSANGTAKQTFTNWGPPPTPDQPNNGNGMYQEDCLVIRGDEGATWFDRPCLTEAAAGTTPGEYGYICAYPI